MKVSIIYSTARRDYPIPSLPQIHQFSLLSQTLARQTFKEFELIVVDHLFDKRKTWWEKVERDYDVLHVFPKDSYWNGSWSLCNTRNTGIEHANGELLVFMDDCSEFYTSDALEIAWSDYKELGAFPRFIFEYWEGGKPQCHLPDKFPSDEKMYQIRREASYDLLLKENKIRIIEQGFCSSGFSTVSNQAAYEVNGFDENYDGAKGLEDADFGHRLALAGYKSLIDIRLRMIEHFEEPTIYHGSIQVRNQSKLCEINLSKNVVRANELPLTNEEITDINDQRLVNHSSSFQLRRL